MAEALVGIVFENLATLVQTEFATLSGIKPKAQKLSTTLHLIKSVLEHAEEKQVTDPSIKVWLQQLKDAVYVLDDTLDECSIKSSQLRGLSSLKPKNIMFRHEIGNKLKEISSRLDQIAEIKNKFLLRETATVKERPTEVAEWRKTSSFIAEPKVFGRKDDKEKIAEFLLTQARDSDVLSVYPIVGLGGVGKTTLTQLVYNDHRVSSHFNLKMWVCVSDTFSVEKVICSIIESINGRCDALNSNVIKEKLKELLQGKRYFLVLDDVWNTNKKFHMGLNQQKWNELKSVLSCGSKGSSILVSTRDQDVATIMGTCQSHTLSGLSDNDCWLLFKQYAFQHDKEERADLVAIGKEIVKKCGGLPLAAQALGGLLQSRNEEAEWLEIKQSELWDLQYENSILPALSLSYFHLSATEKQCFAFCAVFPKDTEILKEELIHLWMANGFISSRPKLDVEGVGNMIWNELCKKSFFQDIQMDDYSGNMSFKMHDLIHDLAQSVTKQECVILEKESIIASSTHHISFDPSHLIPFDESSFKKVESLRTLFQMSSYGPYDFDYFPTNCSLRVLCTSCFQVSSSSFERLIHLRYLELHDFYIKTLPDSICSLQKLQILKITNFEKLRCLPKRMACLKDLRHLIIRRCYRLSHMFPCIKELSSLRTLSVYIVSLEKGHSLAELGDLKLGGKLNIRGLKNVDSLFEAKEAKLMDKKNLRELCLSWESDDEICETPANNVEQVFEVLQPHSNLKGLKIHYYEGLYLPSWINTLSNLATLKLTYCDKCVRLPPLGKLPFLKNLELKSLKNLQYIDDDDDESHDGMEVSVFPTLEAIVLERLPNLERLLKIESGKMFPCLSSLTIDHCPKLRLPCLPSLEYIRVYGCNDELLRSISTFCGLTTLTLREGKGITSFPEGMFRNLTCLKDLNLSEFHNLKELSNEPFNLALESLYISSCRELESLSKQIWAGLLSLKTMTIDYCIGLRCLPEGIQNLTSLEFLRIAGCPTLKERCKEGTGEDWDKIAHIPKLNIS